MHVIRETGGEVEFMLVLKLLFSYSTTQLAYDLFKIHFDIQQLPLFNCAYSYKDKLEVANKARGPYVDYSISYVLCIGHSGDEGVQRQIFTLQFMLSDTFFVCWGIGYQ